MYGKCADMFGRRICFLFATGSYLIGAVLCGAAQSMIMLIVARALCGLGIGAFDTLMKIVVAGIYLHVFLYIYIHAFNS